MCILFLNIGFGISSLSSPSVSAELNVHQKHGHDGKRQIDTDLLSLVFIGFPRRPAEKFSLQLIRKFRDIVFVVPTLQSRTYVRTQVEIEFWIERIPWNTLQCLNMGPGIETTEFHVWCGYHVNNMKNVHLFRHRWNLKLSNILIIIQTGQRLSAPQIFVAKVRTIVISTL